jgi:hypothetical protein
LRVFIDPDLLQFDEVWATAGTWNDVFGIEPSKLVEASGGVVTDLKRAWNSCYGLLCVRDIRSDSDRRGSLLSGPARR